MASSHAGIVYQRHGQTTLEHLPLEEVRVRAWVVDVSSRIVLTQTFRNPRDGPTARAKYVFPLPAYAAVCAFELELEDGSVIVGEVKETQGAASAFRHAVDQGKVAALVEQVTNDMFTISVGSIPAATTVVARLTFVMDLLDEALSDHVRLQLPMHIAQRYGTTPAAILDTSAADSHTRVHIRVDIQTSDTIYHIRSPTHPISLRRYKVRSGERSHRRMSAFWKSSQFLATDFVLTIHSGGLDKPRCFAEVLHARGDGSWDRPTVAMQLTLVSKFQAPKVPSQEYIFVIDRSGSMDGDPIEAAKQTLIMLLRLLPSTQTTFNIFSFGNHATPLWQSSRVLNQTSLMQATAHVNSMSANMGGTEIPKALQLAFNARVLDRPSVIFLLTDGQIYEDQSLDPVVVVSNAIQNSPAGAPTRLFVLGIGTNVSSDVCSHLAWVGGGECLFAASARDIFAKCARLLNAGRSRNIECISIDWGHDASNSVGSPSSPATLSLPPSTPALSSPPFIQQVPHSLTRILSGFRFTVFAITLFEATPTSVRLITKLDGDSELQELTVDVTKVKPFRDSNEDSIIPMVHVLAARKLILELDQGVAPLPVPASSDALVASEDDLRRAGIIRLGLNYQLVSKYTSFVAIGDEARRRNKGGGSGSMAWARSRLGPAKLDSQEGSLAAPPTFLDGLINGISFFFAPLFGFSSNTAASSRPSFDSRSLPQLGIPGAYNDSDSSTGDTRGRMPTSSSVAPRRRGPSSHHSTGTFSSLSSLEGSNCSACRTSSRSPSPLPRVDDPPGRAPSPDVPRGRGAQGGPGTSNMGPGDGRRADSARNLAPFPQDVYALFQEMDVDGSFSVTPLLTRVVGAELVGHADALGVDAKVWATVLVVAYIRTRLQSEPDLLDLVSEKASEFVGASRTSGAMGFEDMVREAVRLLGPPGS